LKSVEDNEVHVKSDMLPDVVLVQLAARYSQSNFLQQNCEGLYLPYRMVAYTD